MSEKMSLEELMDKMSQTRDKEYYSQLLRKVYPKMTESEITSHIKELDEIGYWESVPTGVDKP